MTTELMIPTVHLNGTSKQALLDQLGDAIDAVHEAGRKLAAACPNGRDYYTQGSGATLLAVAQHEARMAKLKDVATELETIMGGVADQ
jgi:hypothetical protein